MKSTKEYKKKWRKTYRGHASRIYENQVRNCKKRNHEKPKYTLDQLYHWLLNHKFFYILWDQWRKSGYERNLAPSVDRKDNSKTYSFDNIQLNTWRVNRMNWAKDQRECMAIVKIHPQKSINKYSIDGELICNYMSVMDAKRSTGISNGNISMAANGIRKTAGGFKWGYTK